MSKCRFFLQFAFWLASCVLMPSPCICIGDAGIIKLFEHPKLLGTSVLLPGENSQRSTIFLSEYVRFLHTVEAHHIHKALTQLTKALPKKRRCKQGRIVTGQLSQVLRHSSVLDDCVLDCLTMQA